MVRNHNKVVPFHTFTPFINSKNSLNKSSDITSSKSSNNDNTIKLIGKGSYGCVVDLPKLKPTYIDNKKIDYKKNKNY